MGNRKPFSCRLDERTITYMNYLHDEFDWGYGQLIDIAIKLLYRLDDRYPIDKDMIAVMRSVMEDLYN